jgi:hypothetical protein
MEPIGSPVTLLTKLPIEADVHPRRAKILCIFIVSSQAGGVLCVVTGLWGGRPGNRCSIPGRGKTLILQSVHTGSDAKPVSCLLYTRGGVSFCLRPCHEAAYSPKLMLRLRMGGALPPLAHLSSWRGQRPSFIG